MICELLFSLGFSLVFSLAPILLFFRAARAASRPGGTPGIQEALSARAARSSKSTEAPRPVPKGIADIDWDLFLLDDETIAALERELDAYVWPPDTPDATPPTDH